MAFLGKEYKFTKQENFEEYGNALGLTPEQALIFINYRPNQKFVQDGDSYTFITVNPWMNNEITFQSGVAFDENIIDRNCKTTFIVDGNTVTQIQKYDDGETVNIIREFTGNEMVATLTTSKWSGSARRYYKA